MKQLTKEQSIKFSESKIYKDWNYEQIVRFQLFQNRFCMDFSIFHEAVEKVLNRSVFTHEFGLNYKGIILEYLGENDPPTLKEIIELIPKEKRLFLKV